MVLDQPSNIHLVELLADAYKLHKDVNLEVSGWKELAEKNPSIQLFQDLLLTAYEAQIDLLNTTEIINDSMGSISKLRIRSPYLLKQESLFKSLYLSVDTIYGELDRLESSGFAIGLDILPEDLDVPVAHSSNTTLFTGCFPCQESYLLIVDR